MLNSIERTSLKYAYRILWFIGPLAFLNQCIRIENASFLDGFSIPAFPFKGVDFKIVHNWAVALSKGIHQYLALPNNYPPFVSFAFLPLSKLSPDKAYNIYTFILLLSFLGMIWFSQLENLIDRDRSNIGTLKERFTFAFLVFTTLISTYPILFALERGNSDLVSGFFSALTLYLITQRKFKWSILTLTTAIHIKIYPIILGPLLLLRAGWKAAFQLAVLTLAAFFIVGPSAAKNFFSFIYISQTSPYVWKGNHSLKSCLEMIPSLSPESRKTITLTFFILAGLIFIGAFIRIWILKCLKKRTGLSEKASGFSGMELGFIGMAFQFMSLIPGESHDYKLGIQLIPYLMILSRDKDALGLSKNAHILFNIVLSIAMALLFMTPSTQLLAKMPLFVIKTPWIVVLFILYGFISFRSPSQVSGREPLFSAIQTQT